MITAIKAKRNKISTGHLHFSNLSIILVSVINSMSLSL